MTTYNWITVEEAVAIHQLQLKHFGGAFGVRYPGGLTSALARPQHLFFYGTPTLAELGAAYAYGLSRNHPFVDGNKRTSWVVARTFLLDHGFDVDAKTQEKVAVCLALADGSVSEQQMAEWLVSRMFAVD